MIELILIAIFFALQVLATPREYSLVILIIIVIHSIKSRNPRAPILIVLLLILRSIVNNEVIINLYKSIHTEIYLSFSSFIDNSFPSNIVIFLISITVGTAEVKLSKNTYDIFKQFNLLHVVSISGANFSLIKDIFDGVKKYFNNHLVNIFVFSIQSYYILLIGISNLPALRAYIFMAISIYSSLTGRPINFINKLLTTIILITCINQNSLTSISFWFSIGFSIIYKSFELRPLKSIFSNELKKLSIIFIISVVLFNSSNPDFIANIIFGLLYPIIFIGTFLEYFLDLINIHLRFLIELISLLIQLIFDSLNQLSSTPNTYAQLAIFIAILVTTLKASFNRRKHEYSKFAQ